MSPARRVGGLLAGFLVLAFLGIAVIKGRGSLASYDWRFEASYMALTLLAVFACLAIQAAGYVLILERLAARPLPRLRLSSIWTRSMLGRYVPGNVMMLAGRVVLGREAGVAGRHSLAASVYEQAYTLALAAIPAVGVLLYIGDASGPWLWPVALVPAGLFVLHPRVFAPVSTKLLTRFRRQPLDEFLSTRDVALFAGLYAVSHVFLGIGVWALVRGLVGAQTGGPLVVGAGYQLAFVVSMLAFVFPSGLGVREGIFALVLARNLPGDVAIGAAAATRLGFTLLEVAFAAAVILLARMVRS